MNQGTQTHSTSIGSKGKHITFSERQLIERWVREKKSVAQIASLLARHRITIYRELKRGRVKHLDSELREYSTHPCCASERSSNEKANRFIRRFSPKGSDFSRVSQKTLSSLLSG